MKSSAKSKKRYGMVIDLDKCGGCGSCMVACSVENNVPAGPKSVTARTSLTWLRVYPLENGKSYPATRTAYFPIDRRALRASRAATAPPR